MSGAECEVNASELLGPLVADAGDYAILDCIRSGGIDTGICSISNKSSRDCCLYNFYRGTS